MRQRGHLTVSAAARGHRRGGQRGGAREIGRVRHTSCRSLPATMPIPGFCRLMVCRRWGRRARRGARSKAAFKNGAAAASAAASSRPRRVAASGLRWRVNGNASAHAAQYATVRTRSAQQLGTPSATKPRSAKSASPILTDPHRTTRLARAPQCQAETGLQQRGRHEVGNYSGARLDDFFDIKVIQKGCQELACLKATLRLVNGTVLCQSKQRLSQLASPLFGARRALAAPAKGPLPGVLTGMPCKRRCGRRNGHPRKGS